MEDRILKVTLRRQDFSANFNWRDFCEELHLDPIAPSIEIAILVDECRSN
jgi:hypothetical protein